MTIYDEPPASDGKGGLHPLAGVPQEALDAAFEELRNALPLYDQDEGKYEPDDVEAIAHAVLSAALHNMGPEGETTTADKEPVSLGHVFRITHTVALGPEWWGEESTIEVRAWSLRDAFLKAARLPFDVLMNGVLREEGDAGE